MPHFEPIEIVLRLIVLMLAGIVTSWTWLTWRLLTGEPILPTEPLVPRQTTPLRFGSVFIAFILYLAVNLGVAEGYRLFVRVATPPLSPVQAADTKGAARAADANGPASTSPKDNQAVVATPKQSDERKAETARPDIGKAESRLIVAAKPRLSDAENRIPWSHLMGLNAVGTVILLFLIPLAVVYTSGVRLQDLGLCFEHGWRQALCGIVATLIVAPGLYAIQYGAARIWTPEDHPLSKMISKELTPAVGLLAVVSAVVLAPLFEELVFRGLIQSWLTTLIRRAQSGSLLAGPLAGDRISESEIETERKFEDSEGRDLRATLAMSKLHPALASVEPGYASIAITSAFFAYVHAPQWPAPIALFVLAVVIGIVYYRTGSLISAICMHATFNAISTLMLFAAVLSGAKFEDAPPVEAITVERRLAVDRGILGGTGVEHARSGHKRGNTIGFF
jgi:membrane protease YdiL (CAAX protease family)